MAHSYAEQEDLTCPQCNRSFQAEIWLIVSATERPDLLEQVKARTLHNLPCPHCGRQSAVDAPLLLFRPDATPVILFSPSQDTTQDQDQEHAWGLVGILHERLGPAWRDEWLADGLSVIPRQVLPAVLGDDPEAAMQDMQAQADQELERLREQDPEAYHRVEEQAQQAMRAVPMTNLILQFVLAHTWGESHQIVAQHPELLSDEADVLLEELVQAQQDEGARQAVQQHRAFLRRCRQVGLEAAVAEKVETSVLPQLQSILQELGQLARRSDMPRRIELCRQALRLISRQDQPSLWAALQFALGNSLAQNPWGERVENLEAAIVAYQQALEVRTRQAMPVEWATTMMNLATACSNRTPFLVDAERGENLEAAIAAYQQVLEVISRQAMPVEWAQAMMNLANAYRNRIYRERAENLEAAIAACQQALEVFTRQAMPVEWASTMNNLAIAYSDRIWGDRAENLEGAIAAYQQVLEVTSRQAMPVEWATTMVNLATDYRNRIRGERAENLETAIAAYQQALEVFTRQAMPVEWAQVMNSLANVYVDRIRGERAENLEAAIAAYQQALEVRTRQAMPVEWATTTSSLAIAYSNRIRGNRAENLETAIEAYQQALEVFTRQAMPIEWAQVMNSLADAYADRIRGERAENLEAAIAAYQQALEVQTRQAMPVKWATTTSSLAIAYSNRIRGNRAENLEAAIEAYQRVLEVFTRQAMPIGWANTMMNLATTYYDRIQGDRAENLEAAIAACLQALEVFTRQAMPVEWATTMMNLAIAYSSRIRGERAENLEAAIAVYQQALEVRTRQAYPYEWAQVMNNLASAYRNRIHGDRAENIEQAIDCYQQALEVKTRQVMPIEWATTKMNLANAYYFRVRGERAENLETAIVSFQRVLEVFTRQAMPADWAQAMMNLANAYRDRIHGDQAENIEQAIDCYQQALEVRTRHAHPYEWAQAMSNLANAYSDRVRGERAENREVAIVAYQQVLEVFTCQAMPVDWAQAMMNLATVYRFRIRGNRAENIEQAIDCYQRALEVRTRQAMPREWAEAMINLADAYSDRTPYLADSERAENTARAIDAYQQALQVMTRQAMPAVHRLTQSSLGHVYFGERRWQEAVEAYCAAMAAGDDLLASAYTEVGRRAEVAETAQLYTRAAYCQLQLGQLGDALVELEAGKTRLLSRALALWEADIAHLPTAQRKTLQEQRQTIRELEAEMRLPPDTPARRSDRDLAEGLRLARADLNQLIGAIRQDHPDFMPLGLTLREILALTPEGGALVAPVITSQGSAVFVVPHGAETVPEDYVIKLDQLKDENLNAQLVGTEIAPGWLRVYLDRDPQAWNAAIEITTQQLWQALMSSVHERLQQLGVQRVILMSSGGLQLLPLHAAWRMENGVRRYFMDDYEVIFAPSAFALKASHARAQSRTGQTALVAGVSEYKQLPPLHFTRAEAEEVGKLFKVQSLMDSAATPEAVREQAGGAAYVHLSCHGSFAWGQDPLASAVYLADDRPLTLADILGHMDFNSARLVTLSACETGISDIRQSPDEYVGLPAGFLQAGAAGVVSSLWSVNDLSTALLMIRFYENHLKGNMPPAQALRQAQLWLRDVTNAELSELFDFYRKNASDAPTRMTYATAQENFRQHTLSDPNERPFAHPYYWAAFAFYGA